MRMPEVDQAVLDRRERIASALRTIVPGEGVIALERELRASGGHPGARRRQKRLTPARAG